MRNQIKTKVAIVGGGISGLAAAHFLVRNGINVTVIEKNERIGGAIRSERRNGFLVEFGPNSTLDTTPLLHEMFSNLGIEDRLEYASEEAKNRYIVRGGKLNALPMSPPAFIKSRLFSFPAKLQLLKEPFIPAANPGVDESLAEFVRRRLGDEFLDYAINPFVAGVYAGKPESLSVQSAFPKLRQLEEDYGSLIKGAILGARKRRKSKETAKTKARLFSFQNGLQTLVDALGKDLSGHIYTGSSLERIRREESGFVIEFAADRREIQLSCDALLLTVPAHAYPILPFEFDFPVTDPLQQIYYPPLAMVFFGYTNKPSGVHLDGFGFLAPEKENRNILGSIWSSTIFSSRAPQQGAALTTFVGGSRQPENALLPDDQLVTLVRRDIEELMGIPENPDFVAIQKWERAIPQYQVGHRHLIDQVEKFEKDNPGVFIGGNFRAGISIADCVKQSHGMSERIAVHMKREKRRIVEAV